MADMEIVLVSYIIFWTYKKENLFFIT